MEWIKVTARELTEEEKREVAEVMGFDPGDVTHEFTCQLPEDGQEILISQKGKWVETTIFCNDDMGVGDEDGNDWNCNRRS